MPIHKSVLLLLLVLGFEGPVICTGSSHDDTGSPRSGPSITCFDVMQMTVSVKEFLIVDMILKTITRN